jgi:hypothetical protein
MSGDRRGRQQEGPRAAGGGCLGGRRGSEIGRGVHGDGDWRHGVCFLHTFRYCLGNLKDKRERERERDAMEEKRREDEEKKKKR